MRVPVSAKNFAVLAAALVWAAPATAQCGPPDEGVPAVRDSLLVTTGWLAAHRGDSNLVILHVDHMTDGYSRAHIPGARHVDAMAFTVGDFDLPPLATIDSLAESLGITPTSRVVIYGDPWVTGIVFVALDQLGHGNRTAMLDGGLEQWRADGRPVTTQPAVATRARYTPRPQPGVVVDAPWVRAHLADDHVAVLDVRTAEEYAGAPGRDASHGGHLPGARLLSWSQVFERPVEAEQSRASRFKSPRAAHHASPGGRARRPDAGGLLYRRHARQPDVPRPALPGLRPEVLRRLDHRLEPPQWLSHHHRHRQRYAMIMIAAALALSLQAPDQSMLVSASWLAQHARDPNLVLLHVGPRASYDSAHIAGAQFIGFADIEAPRDSASTAPVLELPTPARFDSILEARGISDDSRIVIYQSDEWFTPATRVYLTLYWAGLGARTSILDGGMAGWRARGGAVTAQATPAAGRGSVTLHPRGDVVVTADFVAAHLNDPRVAIVDARNERFYLGNYPARPDQPRPGHVPGAFNIPFTAIVNDSGLVLSPEVLRDYFTAAHAEAGDTVVAYCHIGQQATLVWFAARLAGYEARLYDGSFTQWSNPTQYQVERP